MLRVGLGPVVRVNTSGPVDIAELVATLDRVISSR